MTYDAATWGAFACVLSALAGVLSWNAYRRHGFGAGVRGAGWTLLPIAAWLTGTLRLLAEVLTDVGDWAARLVFSPTVWFGIVLAGVAVVLIGVGGLLGRRGGPDRAPEPRATGPGAPEAALPRSRRARAKGRAEAGTQPGTQPGKGDGEFDEIEDILRRHGIS